MPLEVGGGAPSASDIKSPETRPNREVVVGAFNTAFSEFEKAKKDGELKTPKELWAFDALKDARDKTDVAKGKDTFANEVAGGEIEGIPTEDLLRFLGNKIDLLPADSDERKTLTEAFAVLNHKDVSQSYNDRHKIGEPRRIERIRQEAHVVYKDPRRSTGSALKDWDEAVTTITNRRELVLPPDDEKPVDLSKPAPAPVAPVESPPPAPVKAPTPDSVDETMRTIAIVNGNARLTKHTREDAELKLREEQRRGSWWNPYQILRKSWLHVFEEGYRQKYIKLATEAKLTSGNSFATTDFAKKAAIDANNKIGDDQAETQATIERVKLGETIAGENIVEVKGVLKEAILNEILRPMIEGKNSTLTNAQLLNAKDVQKALTAFVEKNQKNTDVQEAFGKKKDLEGKLAEFFATDLYETAELIKQDIAAHKYSLDKLDQHIDIKFANTHWAAETDAHFTNVDKFIAWAQRHGVSAVGLNPVTVGVISSLATFGLMRLPGGAARTVAPIVAPIAGSLIGGTFAAFRRNTELKRDIASHRAERAYNMQIPKEFAGRREALEDFHYETATVGQLLHGGEDRPAVAGDNRGLRELLSLELATKDPNEMANVLKNQAAVLRRVAEIKTRLDFSSDKKVDLVTFDAREKVEHGRYELLKAVVEARLALKKAGMSDADVAQMEKTFRGEWSQRFMNDKKEQDRRFLEYRIWESAKTGGIAAVVGGVTALGTQEIAAQAVRHIPGAADIPILGRMQGKTFLERILNEGDVHLPGEMPTVPHGVVTKEILQDLYTKPGSLKITDNLYLHVDGNENPYNASLGEIAKYADAEHGLMAKPLPTPPFRVDNGSILMSGSKQFFEDPNTPSNIKDFFKGWHIEENVTMDDRFNIQHKLTDIVQSGKESFFVDGNLEGHVVNGQINVRLLQDHLEDPNIRYDKSAGDALFGRVKPEFEGMRKFAIEVHGTLDQTPDGPVVHVNPTDPSNLDAITRANPDGTKFSDVIGRELLKDQWHVKGLPGLPTQEWTPPQAMRLTPPEFDFDDAIPIALPMYPPRHPLEPLEPYIRMSSIYGGELNPERKKLFEKQRSPTLLKNPDAVLDPYEEAKAYFERQKAEYTQEIKALEETIGTPPSPNTRAIICIPVAGHQEEKNIYDSLMNYTFQDAAKDKYEILLLVNYPEVDKAGKPIKPDNTLKEIERFQKDHPDMPIKVVQKVMSFDQANIGTVRKYLNDIALYRQMKRGKDAGDVILISNDADNKGIAPTYLSNFIEKFDKNKDVDAMLAQLDWDPESYTQYPLVHIGTRLFQYLNTIGRHNTGRMVSSGANSAFRGSIYAGIGGYIPGIDGEDIAIGQAIIEARGEHDRIGFAGANVSRLYTSSRRAIDALKSGLVPVIQWNKGFSAFDDEIRRMELGKEKTINYDDPKQVGKLKTELEAVIDKTLDTYEEGERIGKGAEYYKKAMRYIGIQYSVKDGHIEITNMDVMTRRLKQYQKIGVLLRDIKSGKGTPEMQAELKRLNEEYQDTLETTEAERKRIKEEQRKEVDTKFAEFEKTPHLLPDIPDVPFTLDDLKKETNTITEGDYVLCLDKTIGSGHMGVIIPGYNKTTGKVYAFKRVDKKELDYIAKVNNYPKGVTDIEDLIKTSTTNPMLGVYEHKIDKPDQTIKTTPLASTTLDQYIETHGPLPADEALTTIIELTKAMRDLHDKGILHLDLSPTNVLLGKDGMKVIDFNAASVKSGGRYSRGFTGGFRWMIPPELFTENPTLGENADTYEASILLYRLLTGKYPYHYNSGDTTTEQKSESLKKAHQTGTFDIPSSLPDSIQAILKKGIQPNPKRRYQSADEMLNDLLDAYAKLSP